MGASSVTGVGPGSVEGHNMGSKHYTVGVGRLIGPRVMVANKVTLDGSGDATVILPLLSGVVGNYIVLATTSNATAYAVSAVLTFDTNDSKIVFKGQASTVVQYAVIKVGLTT